MRPIVRRLRQQKKAILVSHHVLPIIIFPDDRFSVPLYMTRSPDLMELMYVCVYRVKGGVTMAEGGIVTGVEPNLLL